MKLFTKTSTILMLAVFCVLSISATTNSSKTNLVSEITLSLTQKAPTAADKSDGIVTIIPSGGVAPYKLIVATNTRSSNLLYEGNSFELKNLSKGFYHFTVTDSKGAAAVQSINL